MGLAIREITRASVRMNEGLPQKYFFALLVFVPKNPSLYIEAGKRNLALLILNAFQRLR